MLKSPPKTISRTNRKLERYIEFINSFDFEVIHASGTSPRMAMADYLSRPADETTIQIINQELKN